VGGAVGYSIPNQNEKSAQKLLLDEAPDTNTHLQMPIYNFVHSAVAKTCSYVYLSDFFKYIFILLNLNYLFNLLNFKKGSFLFKNM